MDPSLVQNLAVLVLAGFLGYVVISRVPVTLHTPLMSGTNAIHGIVVLAALIVLGLGVDGTFNEVILVIAIIFGTINVVGGFLVTDRMLGMFKTKPQARQGTQREGTQRGETQQGETQQGETQQGETQQQGAGQSGAQAQPGGKEAAR